ncbi:MAG: YdiY family protein [Opitutales bacterium]
MFTVLQRAFLAGPIFATLAASAQDTVETKTGAILTGELMSIDGSTVVLQTPYAGEVTIERDQVSSIETEAEGFVAFADGTKIRGPVQTVNGQVRVSQVSRPLENVEAFWRPGEEDPEVAALKAQQRDWRWELDLGISGKSGNSEELGFNSGVNAWLEGPTDTLNLFGRYRYSETDDEVSRDDARAGVDYQQDFYEGFLWYVRSELGRDAVEDLDLFTESAAGLGYKFIDNERQELRFRSGLAYRFESYSSGRTESFPGLDANARHEYNFDWATLLTNLGFILSLTDTSQYILTHSTEIDFDIFEGDRWAIRAGVENEYNGSPEPGNENLDTTYFTSIVLSLD